MKVQNEMSTRISVDAVKAIGNMNAFRNAIRGASDAWRAQELALKNSGNYADAAKARLSGLNDVIDLQKAKIAELRSRQEDLDASNKKQTAQFVRLERQIQQANRQLASYEAQASRAKNAVRYQASGLAALQRAYKQSQSASAAYVGRLNAEGRKASATVEKYRQLRSSLQNLESQYRKQEFLLRQVANESGKDSAAYVKQREQLDKTAASIAKTKNEMKSLNSAMGRFQPTGIKKVDDQIVKLNDHSLRMRTRMTSALDSIKSHAMSLSIGITAVATGVISATNKASAVQKTMIENQNLMTTAGEKSANAQREVNRMYSDGEKYSVQYGVSQHTIAQGYQDLIKRGYDGRQAVGAMKSILEASRASGDDFNDTLKVTASTLEAFGMRSETVSGQMRNTSKVASILAKGADVTSTNFQNLGISMQYAGSTAKASGVSLKETTAVLGVLSNRGMEASQAGTSLRRILSRLAAPTNTANEAVKKYGMSMDDFRAKSGKLKSVSTIFKEINAHVPKAERLQFFNKVFGQTGQNAAIILSKTSALAKDNSQSLAHVEDQLKTAYSEDYVGKLARKNMRSAKNSQDRFKYAAQAIQIEIGRNMLPALSKASVAMANAFGRKDTQRGLQVIGKGLGVVANAAAGLITFIGKHTTTVKVFGSVLLAAFAGTKLLSGIGLLRMKYLPEMATGLKAVGSAVKIATLGFNPWVIAIEAVIAAFTLLYKHSAKFRHFVNGLAKSAKKGMKNVGKWFKSTFADISKWHQKSVRDSQRHNRQAQRNWDKYMRNLKRSRNNYWRQHNRQEQRNQRLQERQEQQSQRRRSRAIANFNKNMARGSSNLWRQLQRNTNNGVRNAERSWNNMSKRIGRTSSSLWKGMSKGAQEGWRDVERAAQNGAGRVSRWYQQMNENTSRTVQNMRQQHPKLFNAMYKVVEDRSSLWHDVTTGHWNRVSSDTQHLASDMSNAHRQLFGAMYDKLNDLTHGGLGKIFDGWNNTLHQIHDAVVNVGGAIQSAWHSLMNGIIDVFSQLIDGIIKGINWVLNHVGGDGNLQPINLGHFANGTNGPIAKHQLAVLNDAPGDNYREMVHKKSTGKTILLPAQRNLVMPLEPGDEVLDGKRVAALFKQMGAPVPHADGAIGDFFSGLWNGAKDIEDMAEDALKDVVGFGKSLFRHFVDAVIPKPTDTLGSGLKLDLPGFFATRLKDWMKKQLELLDADSQGVVSRDKFERIAKHAAALMHQQLSEHDIDRLYHQAQTESGVNAGQNGGYDDGDGTGLPIGLFQFKVGTWGAATRHLPANHHNIHSALDQIMAVLADSTWRSDIEQLGEKRGWSPHGYAYGGFVTQHGLYEVAEGNNPEAIIPLDASKRGRAYQLLTEVLARFKGEEGGTTVDDTRMTQQVAQLDRKFAALLDQNQQLLNLIDKLIGVTGSANNPTARYRRTQRDINLAHAQAFS